MNGTYAPKKRKSSKSPWWLFIIGIIVLGFIAVEIWLILPGLFEPGSPPQTQVPVVGNPTVEPTGELPTVAPTFTEVEGQPTVQMTETGAAEPTDQPIATPTVPATTLPPSTQPPLPTATRVLVSTSVPEPQFKAWRAEYFANPNLAGTAAFVRDDPAPTFNWGTAAPAAGMPADAFSVRWQRTLSFEAGAYHFYVSSDDGVRVWLDSQLIIDQWHDAAGTTYSAERSLVGGSHSIRIEYYDNWGEARLYFWWEKISQFPDWQAQYYANASLSGSPAVTRNDVNINFDWGRNSPMSGLPADGFSVRWSRSLHFEAGFYRFQAIVDDGVRIFVDGSLVLGEWRDGSRREVSADTYLSSGTHQLVVEYYERTGDARIQVWWQRQGPMNFPDWKGEYFANRQLSGSAILTRNDAKVEFDWGSGSPAVGLPVDGFSARWSRTLDFQAGVYRFFARSDDGVRVYFDGRRIIDEWHDSNNATYQVDVQIVGGRYPVMVEYYENAYNARIRVWFERISALPTATAQPTSAPTATPTFIPPPTLPVMPTATSTATASPTATATATPSPTSTPTATPSPTLPALYVSEFLPVPGQIDWNEDGIVDENDSWIELYNSGKKQVNLNGWSLDNPKDGLAPYHFPAGTILGPGKYLLLFRSESGIDLSKGGELLLSSRQEVVIDRAFFVPIDADTSYSRDQKGQWHVDWTPSPGLPNAVAVPTGVKKAELAQ